MQEIPSPGDKVVVSYFGPVGSALTRYIASWPLVQTTAIIAGITGFQATSLMCTPGGVMPAISKKGLVSASLKVRVSNM